MFHNSELMNIQAPTPQQRVESSPIKSHGSHIHRITKLALSNKTHLSRDVYKTRAKHPPQNKKLTNGRNQSQNSNDKKMYDANFDGTFKIVHLDLYQQITKTFLRFHYRCSVKRYLTKRYSVPAFMVPAEAFECMRRTKIQIAQDSLFQSKVLCLCKPYFHENITSILKPKNKSLQSFKKKPISKIAIQLVACAIEGGGIDNFFMTTDNVYSHEDTLVINYTSITGIPLVNCRQPIGKNQLHEIYPYLTEYIYEKGTRIRKIQENVDYQQNWGQIQHFRVRSILIVLLSIILENNVVFDIEVEDTQIKYEQVQNIIKKLPQKFESLLKEQESINKLKHAQQQLMKDKSLGYQSGTLTDLFTQVLVKNQTLPSYDRILKPFTIKRKQNNQEKNEKDKIHYKMHQFLFEKQSQEQKNFYKSHKLNQMELFLPVKYGRQLYQLIANQYWWDSLEDIDSHVKQQFVSILFEELIFYDCETDQLFNDFKKCLKIGNLEWSKPSQQLVINQEQKIHQLKQYFIIKMKYIDQDQDIGE